MPQSHLEWKPEYALGIEDIDNQHKFFINLINRLSGELRDVNCKDHASAIIKELNAYAHFHFISEENLMRNAGYPMLKEHKVLHLKLLDKLSTEELVLDFEFTKQRAEEIIEFLSHWFLYHTVNEDRVYADYIHANDK